MSSGGGAAPPPHRSWAVCTAAHLVPNTCHPQWEVSVARESGRGHALGPALCHVPAQHSLSVMRTPWTCHKCQAESPSLQCVFDHERSKKLGRRSPSFTFYSRVIWRTICPIWAIYCVNFFPRSAAGARWAGARYFCALGVPPHLAGVTPPPQMLLYNLVAGCSTKIECPRHPAFMGRSSNPSCPVVIP